MQDEQPLDEMAETKPKSNRRLRLAIGGVTAAYVILVILETEHKVSRLRDDGFDGFVIESTRNHAYFPLIGAMLGAALAIGLVRLIKKLMAGAD
ncbi:hypothetical protein G6N82_10640 [Altererythrobacter sp. BO-6]|uniref:hypothetical protein n=1 Tax=Altererythrobacter sp. BO-6 TaxID=2604537 RepID=UPI0013E10EA1|nr:hypothetical protein [Altererythrobacter sp. BO-6]QIG54550.1 hypothetical protein G6N82_10640 [Altererythrobacter sp. BO-6]